MQQCHLHDGIDHRLEPDVRIVLQHDNIAIRIVPCRCNRNRADGHQAFRLQLLAPEAHDHHFAAKIRILCKVLQRADRHCGARRIDGDAAAIGMGHGDHVIDVGIFR